MRETWIVLSIAAIMGGSSAASAQVGAQAGGVSDLHGTATADRAATQSNLALRDPIFADDILETGTQGKLRVTFSDNTELTLGPNAEVVIDEFVYAPDANQARGGLASGCPCPASEIFT